MRLSRYLLILAPASLLAIAACGGEDDSSTSGCAEEDFSTAPHSFQFVVNEVQVPTSTTEAIALGLNIDNDSDDEVDNVLGRLLAALSSPQVDIDIQAPVNEAINEGDIILLVDMKATDLTQGCGQVSVYIGDNPNPAACDAQDVCGRHLQGDGMFSIAADSPTETKITGTIAGGGFLLGDQDEPGNFSIELNLIDGFDAVTLDLVGAQIKIGQVSENGLSNGILAGAITEENLETSILPTVKDLIDQTIIADCPNAAPPECCPSGTDGATILGIFDTAEPVDCVISIEEIKTNPLTASSFRPDLDLLDASGNYNPNQDGTKDTLSIGLGFSTTTGQFQVP